ncbi:MAG: cytochrome c biogenesis protein ResB [Burkholderiaceae bacterium]|nr:cytochrome c biogenesis protein ResB [Burkholderiaceae bacterium]
MSEITDRDVDQTPSRAWSAAVELLSSMRFAIALLTIICIASVIGTVLKQNEPVNNYINQFGPFWAQVFGALDLYAIYSAWWFLLILAFLVISTSLCIARNTPKILADLKAYKEHIREQSLQAFHHRAEAALPSVPEQEAHRIGQMLAGGGWKVRLQRRENGWMVAAKAGAANKIGYIAAHSAIVLICLGGLLDGDLIVRAQTWFNGKELYRGGGLISEVPAQHRLAASNPTFRGNLLVAEGTVASTAILSQSGGILLQDLPFAIELKKFIVEYYSTGMPKLFASDIVIHDKATGEKREARVEVNKPASFKGIEIYQSSFDDGGSRVKLKAYPMAQATVPFEVEGVIGNSTQLVRGPGAAAEQLTLEFSGLRVINVENFGDKALTATGGADVRSVDLRASLEQRLGSGNKTVTRKELRNVGPSVSYKLRDSSGQAREFHNYMLPVDMGEGTPVFLLGVRDKPSEPLRYLRVPADEAGAMDGFVRLRQALQDRPMRELAVQRYAARAVDPARPDMVEALKGSARKALDLFAGVEGKDGKPTSGLQAVVEFMDANVPEAERARAGEVLVRILNGALFELDTVAREKAGVKPLDGGAFTQQFMTQAVLSLGDSQLYPAPMAFLLKDFTQVQASVFQVARAPGKTIVYLGCALLILGIFAMLYVRERRLWVWLAPSTDGTGTRATMALSSNRKTMDGDREFDQLSQRLLMDSLRTENP